MPLKPIKDIDKEVQFPKELEYRPETVWKKIQAKKGHSSRAIIYWFGAASVAFVLGLFLFGNEKEVLIGDTHMVTGRSREEVKFDPKIEKPEVLIVEEKRGQIELTQKSISEKMVVKAEVLEEEKVVSEVELVDSKNEILLNKKLDFKEEKPKELSPAAHHLQKTLAKLNKDKSADQVVLVEKFNLLNDLNVGKVQASTNILPNSIFQSLKKESNERN